MAFHALLLLLFTCAAGATGAVASTPSAGQPMWGTEGHDGRQSYSTTAAPPCMMNNRPSYAPAANPVGTAAGSGALISPDGSGWWLTTSAHSDDDDDTRQLNTHVNYITSLRDGTSVTTFDSSQHFFQPTADVWGLSPDGTTAYIPVAGFGSNRWALVSYTNGHAIQVSKTLADVVSQADARRMFVEASGTILLSSEFVQQENDGDDGTLTSSTVAAFTPKLEVLFHRTNLPSFVRFMTADGSALVSDFVPPFPAFDDDADTPLLNVYGISTSTGKTVLNVTFRVTDFPLCPVSNLEMMGVGDDSQTVWLSAYNATMMCLFHFKAPLGTNATTAALHPIVVWSQPSTLYELQKPAVQVVNGEGSPVLYLLITSVLSDYQHSRIVTVDATTLKLTSTEVPQAVADLKAPAGTFVTDGAGSMYGCFASTVVKFNAAGSVVWNATVSNPCSSTAPLSIGPDGSLVVLPGDEQLVPTVFGCATDTREESAGPPSPSHSGWLRARGASA